MMPLAIGQKVTARRGNSARVGTIIALKWNMVRVRYVDGGVEWVSIDYLEAAS